MGGMETSELQIEFKMRTRQNGGQADGKYLQLKTISDQYFLETGQHDWFWGGNQEGGTQYERPYIRGRAANMSSKISLFVYEWPPIKCKIWYINGSIFQNFPKLNQNWLKFKKLFEKSGDFGQNLAQN